jgi:hypothetical protein
MKRLKAHLLTFFIAAIFAALAYGAVHAVLALQKWVSP